MICLNCSLCENVDYILGLGTCAALEGGRIVLHEECICPPGVREQAESLLRSEKKDRSSMTKKKETKHERFVRVAEQRTQKVLEDLNALGKFYNPAVYEYTEADLEKIYSVIEQKLEEIKEILAGKRRFSLNDDYKD